MLVFSCPHCSIRLRIEDRWAGQLVQCGGCRRSAQAPDQASVHAIPSIVPPASPPRIREATPFPDIRGELYGVLSPPQAPGELGRLGPYRIRKVLGSGRMGIVFLAEDAKLQRTVALKTLRQEVAVDSVSRMRFLREARALAAIEHDHVVALYQVGEYSGILFLVMQPLEGESLEDRLQREGQLPVFEVLRIGREAAEGLAAAHERGIVHRDVNSSNLWLETGGGRVKVFDFGLACPIRRDACQTTSGVFIGSPGYAAPEQVQGGWVDPRTDLFGLGCVLYRCCTGELPFRAGDTVSALAAVVTETPRPVRDLNPSVPPTLADLIGKMLAKDPVDRPPSARAVADTLAAFASGGEKKSRAAESSAQRPTPTLVEVVPSLVPGRS